MKLLLSPSGYTFSASAKTITFSGTIPVDISQILHVSNITRGVLYFQPQAGNLFTGTYNSPTLTLAASTTGHSDSDKLLIFYDDGTIYSRGGGALDGNTQRVTLASDGPGVAALGAPADAAATSDTGAFSILALIKRGLQNWTTLLARVPASQSGALPVGDNGSSLTVDGRTFRSVLTITRPSNATAYTANDVVGIADANTAANAGSAILTLANAGASGGSVLVQSVSLIFSDAAVISGMAGYRLHFYSSSPTAILDNAAFDLVSGDRSGYLGFVDLPTPQDFGSSLYCQVDAPGRMMRLATGSTSLFAQLQTVGAYTPASGSTIEVRVKFVEMGL